MKQLNEIKKQIEETEEQITVSDLMQELSPVDQQVITNQLYDILNWFDITAGPDAGASLVIMSIRSKQGKPEILENALGLPYNTASGFGALWITNNQLELKTLERRFTLNGIAAVQDFSPVCVLILTELSPEGYEMKQIYLRYSKFVEWIKNITNFEDETKKRSKLQSELDHNTEARRLVPEVAEVLSRYTLKKLGPVTLKKINEELSQKINYNCYVYPKYNDLKITITTGKGSGFSDEFYFDNCYNDADNCIKSITPDVTDAIIKKYPVFDVDEFRYNQTKIIEAIEETQKKLADLFDKYNELNKYRNIETLSRFDANLSRLTACYLDK